MLNIRDVTGSDHDDVLTGGDFFNQFSGNEGDDIINGGGGGGRVVYQDDPAGVTVNLATGRATDGYGDTDTLQNIRHVTGSDHDDVLTGDDNDNSLEGGFGDDTLDGGVGDDSLRGGGGSDTVSYADDPAGVTVNLPDRGFPHGGGMSRELPMVTAIPINW